MIEILSVICSEDDLEILDKQISAGSSFVAMPIVLPETSLPEKSSIATIIIVH